ncbi:DUF1330 domain-containing protein [Streptomyces sp. NPDC003393]
MAIDPTQEAINTLLELPDGQPIILMNLLRFAAGGEKTYEDYVRHCKQHGPRFGVEFVYLGKGGHVMVAEDGQSWDAVWIVRYPDSKAFFALLHDADFKSGFHLRGDSLVEAVLQVTTPWEV